MKCKLVLLLHLVFRISAFQDYRRCINARRFGCNCTSQTLQCVRSSMSVDTVLPRIVPSNTRELTMKRVWVAEAIELNSKHLYALNYLRRIDFSQNRISAIHSGTFSDIKTLEYVNLSNNRLKLFDPEAFSGQFPSFKELDLSHNELIVLRDQNFPSLSSMTKLDLRGNNILYLSPGAFIGLGKLERLTFSTANFTQFPSEAFTTLGRTQFLELRNMPHLSTIPNRAFRKNTHMKTLILTEITLSTGGMSEDTFDGLDNLTALVLKSCNLTSVPRTALRSLKNLVTLDLSNNPIQIIQPGDFTSLTELRKLILRRNRLTEIKVEAFSAQKLMNYIDLSNNILKTLYRESFASNLSSLTNLTMANNPWTCDCSLEWIIRSSIHVDKTIYCSKGFKTLAEMKERPRQEMSNCSQPPILETTERFRTIYVGEQAVLPCPYDNANTHGGIITFTWYRNDTILPVQSMDNESGLILKDAQLIDSGRYKCVIRSDGGNSSSTVHLTVHSRAGGDCTSCQGISSLPNIGPESAINCRSSAASFTVLVGVLAFVTALGITGIFIFIGWWWNKRKEGNLTQNVVTAEIRGNGTVFHRVKRRPTNGDACRGVVLGGQGIYSEPLHDLRKDIRPTAS